MSTNCLLRRSRVFTAHCLLYTQDVRISRHHCRPIQSLPSASAVRVSVNQFTHIRNAGTSFPTTPAERAKRKLARAGRESIYRFSRSVQNVSPIDLWLNFWLLSQKDAKLVAHGSGLTVEELMLLQKWLLGAAHCSFDPVDAAEMLSLCHENGGDVRLYPAELQAVNKKQVLDLPLVVVPHSVFGIDHLRDLSRPGKENIRAGVTSLAFYNLSLIHQPICDEASAEWIMLAAYTFECAAAMGHDTAAVCLAQISNYPEYKNIKNSKGAPNLFTDTRSLISDPVLDDPENCDWTFFSTYMDLQYDVANLRRMSPVDIDWAIAWLRRRISSKNYTVHSGVQPLPIVNLPQKHLLRITTFCLEKSVVLPKYARAALITIRDDALKELTTQYAEPEAAYIVAIRNGDHQSSEFWRLIKIAASGGIAHACWLMAIQYWRFEGRLSFLPSNAADTGSKNSPIKPSDYQAGGGLLWATQAITASTTTDSFSDHTVPWLYRRAVTTAAMYLSFGLPRQGEELLKLWCNPNNAEIYKDTPNIETMTRKLNVAHKAFAETQTQKVTTKPGMFDEKVVNALLIENADLDKMIKYLQTIVE